MWINKEINNLIPSILSKIGPQYSLFVSSFHATKLDLEKAWKMPEFNDFAISFTQEHDMLVHMGSQKPSNSHALALNERANTCSNIGKTNLESKKGLNPKSNGESSNLVG